MALFSKTKFSNKENGNFSQFGGCYVSEMLMPTLKQLKEEYFMAKKDIHFKKELESSLKTYVGRPTPLYFAARLTRKLGGAKIYLKNEGLTHMGSHKINNCLGQALLARRMKKNRLITDDIGGQHGIITAAVAAKFGFACTVFIDEIGIKMQPQNISWMKYLGAEVIPTSSPSKTLKYAANAAIKEWITDAQNAYYLLSSAVGPHPYPTIVRDFQAVIGKEVRKQILQQEGRLPDYLIACVGRGSNALGLFCPFVREKQVKMIGVEAGGKGVEKSGCHAARFQGGRIGVIEGFKSFFLQDKDGNILPTYSLAVELNYAGIGPEIAYLYENKRVEFTYIKDKECLNAFKALAKIEGIIPSLESAHAVAEALKLAPKLKRKKIIVINLSGRGDKDLFVLHRIFMPDKSQRVKIK